MLIRSLLIVVALPVIAAVGAFMLYVSVLTILTAIVVLIGLVATLVLGYWAGSSSLDQPG
jgi:hypothetical protein